METTMTHAVTQPGRLASASRSLKVLAGALLAVGTVLSSSASLAQNTPQLPDVVRIVVPFTPGGSNDVYARALAEQLGQNLGRSFIIENKAGAGGSIGSNDVARAKPDGSSLLFSSNSFVTRAAVDSKLPYDVRTSFEPVALVARGPMLLVTNTEVPFKTIPELIKTAKTSPVNYGSAGIGSIGQLSAELFNSLADTQMTHIPYKGIAGGLTDMMGGRIELMITTPASLGGSLDAGRVKAIAVTSPEPSKFFPELPTIAESVPGYSVEVWWGVYAPAGTPRELVDYLNQEIVKVTSSQRMVKLLANEASEPSKMNSEEFRTFVDSELTKWSTLAKERNISLN